MYVNPQCINNNKNEREELYGTTCIESVKKEDAKVGLKEESHFD